jgi:hypothetical protein
MLRWGWLSSNRKGEHALIVATDSFRKANDDINRDEALRQTRRLEAAIIAEREKVKTLLEDDWSSDY